MFALSYIQGGKAQFWRNEAINQIAVGNKPFATFKEFLERLEAQFGDPNPKATANAKLKTMRQGSLMADEFILQFKAEASQMDMGEAMLVEFLKAGLNPSLFKSIYQLPSMPEKLDEWYNWAMRLDRQYWQEQAESKLMYGSSKFGKSSGGKSEKGKAPQAQAPRAQPLAMAVTPIVTESAAPAEAMEVDQAGR